MANSPAKLAAMMFTVVSAVIVTPAMYYIIDFEKDRHHRTLINQVKKSRSPTELCIGANIKKHPYLGWIRSHDP
jgi:hypothetical protein